MLGRPARICCCWLVSRSVQVLRLHQRCIGSLPRLVCIGLAQLLLCRRCRQPAASPPLPSAQVRRVIEDMRQSGQSIDINLVVDRLARES